MPCLFGTAGAEHLWVPMANHFRTVFGDVATAAVGGIRLGAHAHPPLRALTTSDTGHALAAFGEYALHTELNRDDAFSRLFENGELSARVRGNLAVASPDGCLTIGSDWLSCFPLYYTDRQPGVVFSSHLFPLASAIGAGIDPAGAVQFLTEGFCLNGRTPIQGVRRLLPGQELSYSARSGRLCVTERSRLWAGDAEGTIDDDQVWELLFEAIGDAGASAPAGLMLSAGWDSRVLLAAYGARHPRSVLTVSHGQPDQFELRLSRRLAAVAHAQHAEVALDGGSLGRPRDLDDLFSACESLMFPYWQLSSRELAARGAAFASCGVLGEVLGGHYGTMGSRANRVRHVLSVRTRSRHAPAPPRREALEDVLPAVRGQGPWYLTRTFREAHRAVIEAAYAQDREETIDRYARRGIDSGDRAVEAFVAEHRAVQMIAQQPLAASARLPVALPFADRRLLIAVTALPMRVRIQNGLSRRLLSRHARALLRVPLAATCLPASAPILLHDAGRACRRAVEIASDAAFFRSRGRIGRSRPFGWMNFEQVLRPPHSLRAIVEDLRSPVFDKGALLAQLDRVENYEVPIKLAHAYLKIAQADRLFEGR